MHVLSLPPAFALSQDQTLKLDENFNPADHNVLTRSHPNFVCARPRAHASLTRCYTRLRCIALTSVAFTNRVLTKNVDRRSLYPTAPRPQTSPKKRTSPKSKTQSARTPPSTFLFLPIHLSNSPGLATPLPRRARELAKQLPPTRVDDKSPKSEELRRRAIPPSGGAPCVGYICSAAGYCQPCILEFFIRSSSVAAGAFTAVSGTGLLFAIADL